MSISQLSVFVENKAGHLADALSALAAADNNVLSFTIADTADYGILRLVVDQPQKAKGTLEAAGYAVVENEVVCAVLPHRPGALASAVRTVSGSGLDIEYVYLGAEGSLIVKTEELEKLESLLVRDGFRVLGPGETV